MITWEKLYELLEYDPDTGVFTWLKPRGMYKVGDTLKHINNMGYMSVRLDKKAYLVHRLAWFYFYKEWPKGSIDHIDGNQLNNSIDNLRDVTQYINGANRPNLNKNNTSGFKGVYQRKRSGKWRAEFIFKGKKYCVPGEYDTAELAHTKYLEYRGKIVEDSTIR